MTDRVGVVCMVCAASATSGGDRKNLRARQWHSIFWPSLYQQGAFSQCRRFENQAARHFKPYKFENIFFSFVIEMNPPICNSCTRVGHPYPLDCQECQKLSCAPHCFHCSSCNRPLSSLTSSCLVCVASRGVWCTRGCMSSPPLALLGGPFSPSGWIFSLSLSLSFRRREGGKGGKVTRERKRGI